MPATSDTYSVPGQNLSFKVPSSGSIYRLNDPYSSIFVNQGGSVRQLNPQELAARQYGLTATSDVGLPQQYRGQQGGIFKAGIDLLKNQYGIDYYGVQQNNEVNPADIASARNLSRGADLTPDELRGFMGTLAPQVQALTQGLNPQNTNQYTLASSTGGSLSPATGANLPGATYLPQNLSTFKNPNPTTPSAGATTLSPLEQANQIKQQLEVLKAKGYGGVDISQIPKGVDISQLGNYAGTLSATPSITSSIGTGPVAGGISSLSQAEESLKAKLVPSAQENTTQSQLDALLAQQAGVSASRDLGIQAVGEQPIAMPFITGQQAAITGRAATQLGALGAQAVPLQQQLARAQAQRQSAIDVSKFELERQDAARTTEAKLAEQSRQAALESGKIAEQQRQFNITQQSKDAQLQEERALADREFEEDKRQFGLDYAQKNREIAIREAEAVAKSAPSPAAQSTALANVALVDEILKNPGAISGFIQTGSIPFTAGATTKNQYEQLRGVLALANRQQLKGSGAVSDFESKTLDRAASDLGRNQTETNFKDSLKKVRGAFATSAGLSVPVKLTNPGTKESSVINANRAGIDKALSDGLTVEYQ